MSIRYLSNLRIAEKEWSAVDAADLHHSILCFAILLSSCASLDSIIMALLLAIVIGGKNPLTMRHLSFINLLKLLLPMMRVSKHLHAARRSARAIPCLIIAVFSILKTFILFCCSSWIGKHRRTHRRYL